MTPINMVLYCPACHQQHIDAPSERREIRGGELCIDKWDNPPHRSHECQAEVVRDGKLQKCGCVWRPADVPTNGVSYLETIGKADWTCLEIEKASADDKFAGYMMLQVVERAIKGNPHDGIAMLRQWVDANIHDQAEFDKWMRGA